MYLTPGPIDRDYSEGELTNWHLETLNNSNFTARVFLSVYNLYGLYPNPIPIGTTSVDLKPGEYAFLNIEVDPQYEHTIPTIELPNDDVLVTLYGRNAFYKQMAGATFTRNSLVRLCKPLHQKEDEIKKEE